MRLGIALAEADLLWLPVRRSWRLNERHYRALEGKNKAQTRKEFADSQFMLWRRSYDVPPPPIADDDPLSQAADPRYASLPPELVPRSECLKDVVARLLPYWYDAIAALNLPTGIPLVYELDDDFNVVTPGGRYLDPKTAAESAQAVAQQGR